MTSIIIFGLLVACCVLAAVAGYLYRRVRDQATDLDQYADEIEELTQRLVESRPFAGDVIECDDEPGDRDVLH